MQLGENESDFIGLDFSALFPGIRTMGRATSDNSVGWAKGLIKGAGLRSTAARVGVLQQLAVAKRPMTHGDVVDTLKNFGFDQSTIFRSLQELSDAGLVNRLDLGDQVRRFELRSATSVDELEHPHFMCVDCGEVACLEDFAFSLSPSRGPRREQLGEITEVLLKGHCGSCRGGS
jgi:Fur family ferric uptake transcriptional regulator